MSQSPKAEQAEQSKNNTFLKNVAVVTGLIVLLVVVIKLLFFGEKPGNSETTKPNHSQQENTGGEQKLAQAGNSQQTVERPERASATEVAVLALLTQMQEDRQQERRNAVPVADPRAVEMKELRERLAATEQKLAEKSAQPPAPGPSATPDPEPSAAQAMLAEMRAIRQGMEATVAKAVTAPQPQIIMIGGGAPQSQPVMGMASAPIARPTRPTYVVQYHKPRASAATDPCASPAPVCQCADCQNGRAHGTTRVEASCATTPAATDTCDCEGGADNYFSFLNDLFDINIVGGGCDGGGYRTRQRAPERHVMGHRRPRAEPRCEPPSQRQRPCPPRQRGNPNGPRRRR